MIYSFENNYRMKFSLQMELFISEELTVMDMIFSHQTFTNFELVSANFQDCTFASTIFENGALQCPSFVNCNFVNTMFDCEILRMFYK